MYYIRADILYQDDFSIKCNDIIWINSLGHHKAEPITQSFYQFINSYSSGKILTYTGALNTF